MNFFDEYIEKKREKTKRLEKRISRVTCQVMALHPASITKEDLRQRLDNDPNWSSLTWDYLVELIERLYVIDVAVSDVGTIPVFINDITQDNDEGQAPFLEMYFDESGEEQLYANQTIMLEPPEEDSFPCRLRFFLHYVDPSSALEVLDIKLSLPAPTPLPRWLADKMPYEPPN